MRHNSADSVESRFPLGVVVLAMLVGLTLPLGIATALGAFEEPPNTDPEDPYVTGHGPHEDGYNTNRHEVGHGDSPLGEWRMYTSSGPEGLCVEIEVPNLNPPGGGRAFYSECSAVTDADGVNPSTVADERGTLVFGIAPEAATRVEIDRRVGENRAATLRQAANGPHKAFVAAMDDSDPNGVVRALRGDGTRISSQAIP